MIKFKFELDRPCLPSGFYYGYKSNKTTNPLFLNIELSKEKRNEDYILIPYYEDKYLNILDFNNELEKSIYLNNDFIDYKNGIFFNGFSYFGKDKTLFIKEITSCSFLKEENIKAIKTNLSEITYFEFCDLVKEIKEYENEDYKNELRFVTGLGGKFIKLEDKAICCLERINKNEVYISYLAVFNKYRKQGYLEELINGVKYLYKDKKLTLCCCNKKIEQKYLNLGFKISGYLKNYL